MPKIEKKNLRAGTVTKGEANPQQGGYFIAQHPEGKILTFRCTECLQHMSLAPYSIDKTGAVTPEVTCPNPTCGAVFKGLVLDGFSNKLSKKGGETFLR